ncbi:MAG TPA: hypothetical protein VF310_07275, partial [Vicinamibacteria bacterium]
MRLTRPLPTNHGPRRERLARAARAFALLMVLLPVLAACGGRARPQAPTIQVKPVPAANYPRPELL